jgi:hypothetical protein
MINTTAMIAIAAATTPMAISAPVERPFEEVSDVGVVVGILVGVGEELEVGDGVAEKVEPEITAEFDSTGKIVGVCVASDVDELAAAAVFDINVTGTSFSKTPPV